MTDQHTAAPAVDRRALGVALCIAVLAIAFESISVATAMPRAAEELDGVRYYAWTFSLFVIGMLLATVVAGRLADRVGPLRPLVGGMVVFTVGLLVAGAAPTFAQLAGGRLVQGIGAGALNLGLFVVIARAYDETGRARMMTWISSAWVVPAFVGPPVAAWLTSTFSWHWVFFGVLPLVVGAAALGLPALLRLRSSGILDGDPSSRPVPLWAAGTVALGAAAVQLAGQRVADDQRELLTLGLGVIGLAALVLALPVLMPAGFWRLRSGLATVVWTRLLVAGSFFGAEAFVPLMLVRTRGLDLLPAGAVLTVGAVGWFSGSWLQSRSWVRLPRHRLISLGAVCVVLGLAVTALVAARSELWFGLVGPAWVVVGLGMGLLMSSTSVAMMTLSPVLDQGRNSSSLQVGEAIGNAVLAGAAGTVFALLLRPGADPTADPTAFGAVFALMTTAGLLGAALSLRTGRITAPDPG